MRVIVKSRYADNSMSMHVKGNLGCFVVLQVLRSTYANAAIDANGLKWPWTHEQVHSTTGIGTKQTRADKRQTMAYLLPVEQEVCGEYSRPSVYYISMSMQISDDSHFKNYF